MGKLHRVVKACIGKHLSKLAPWYLEDQNIEVEEGLGWAWPGGWSGADSDKSTNLDDFWGFPCASIYLNSSQTLSLSIFIFVITPSEVFDFVSLPTHQHKR